MFQFFFNNINVIFPQNGLTSLQILDFFYITNYINKFY